MYYTINPARSTDLPVTWTITQTSIFLISFPDQRAALSTNKQRLVLIPQWDRSLAKQTKFPLTQQKNRYLHKSGLFINARDHLWSYAEKTAGEVQYKRKLFAVDEN